MRLGHRQAVLGIAALAAVLTFGTTASAAPVSKCNAAKKKCIGKYIAAQMGCHAKAEAKDLPVDSICLGKGVAKITTPEGKGCFDKNDAKIGNDCTTTGAAATTAELNAADAFITDVVNDIDPAYPAPAGPSKCSAAEKKCVGKKAAGMMGCEAKANKEGALPADVQACRDKITDKFGGVKGCYTNAQLKGEDCLVAQPNPTTASIENKVDAWRDGAVGRLDAGTGPCGNGTIDPGEFCDPMAPANPAAACGTDFPCNATTCNCACPTKVIFSGDATDAATVLDTGWTGISHRAPVVTGGDVTVTLTCPGGGTQRPCGTCTVSGPIANAAGKFQDQRCTNDTSIHCTSDAPCTGGGGTCQFFFGTNLPLAAGGVTTCVVNQFNGGVSGTANVESGDAATTAHVTARVYNGIAIDNPCPRCVGDGTPNDGTLGGHCDAGPRSGLTCDSNGSVPNRPDFGSTSLDCPPSAAGIIATLPIDLTNKTAPVTKTLTASNPLCGGDAASRCLCDTCNDLAAEPCSTNADCTGIGTVCGGKRCIGGTNAGASCSNTTACPGGGICGRPGEPTKPSACLDDTSTAGLDCSDTSPVDGEGECTQGPITQQCSIASGHAQRGCTVDGDCGGGGGSCQSNNRACFLTGGLSSVPGTNTLVAVGMADTPVHDTAHPTLGAVFCVGPTGSTSVNNVAGLPGPGRVTIKGLAVAHP